MPAISNVRVGTRALVQNSGGVVGGLNTTPALPASMADNDVLLGVSVVFHDQEGHSQSTGPSPATPSLWSQITDASYGGYMSAKTGAGASPYHSHMRIRLYWARYDSTGVAGPNAAPTISFSSGTQTTDWHYSQLIAFTNAAMAGSPVDVLGTFTAMDATPAVTAAASSTVLGPAAGITTTADGGIVFAIVIADFDTTATGTSVVATMSGDGLTWVEVTELGGSASDVWTMGVDYALTPSKLTVTSKSITTGGFTTAAKSIGLMVAFEPDTFLPHSTVYKPILAM